MHQSGRCALYMYGRHTVYISMHLCIWIAVHATNMHRWILCTHLSQNLKQGPLSTFDSIGATHQHIHAWLHLNVWLSTETSTHSHMRCSCCGKPNHRQWLVNNSEKTMLYSMHNYARNTLSLITVALCTADNTCNLLIHPLHCRTPIVQSCILQSQALDRKFTIWH